MTQLVVVLVCIVFSTVAYVLADAIGDRQWAACFHSEAMSHSSSLTAVVGHLSYVLTTPPSFQQLREWAFYILARAPFIVSAVLARSPRHLFLTTLAASVTPTLYWADVLADDTHDCDRKGCQSCMLILFDILVFLPMFLIWWIVELGNKIKDKASV
jgi:hypothetical protein